MRKRISGQATIADFPPEPNTVFSSLSWYRQSAVPNFDVLVDKAKRAWLYVKYRLSAQAFYTRAIVFLLVHVRIHSKWQWWSRLWVCMCVFTHEQYSSFFFIPLRPRTKWLFFGKIYWNFMVSETDWKKMRLLFRFFIVVAFFSTTNFVRIYTEIEYERFRWKTG